MKLYISLILLVLCCLSFTFARFNFDAIESGNNIQIEEESLSDIYSNINYSLWYKKKLNDFRKNGSSDREIGLRMTIQAPVNKECFVYDTNDSKKISRKLLQALRRKNMKVIQSLIEDLDKTDRYLFRCDSSYIKPMVVENGILGFSTSSNDIIGSGYWLYQFVQDDKLYTLHQTFATYTDTGYSYITSQQNNTFKEYISGGTRSPVVRNVEKVFYGTGLNGTEEYKLIRKSYDEFVKQIKKGWEL